MKNINKLGILSFIVILMILNGCNRLSLPSDKIMKEATKSFNLPKLPEKGKALVYIIRPEFLGGLINFNVYLDNKLPSSQMGYTKGKEYIYFNVTPGKHIIKSLA